MIHEDENVYITRRGDVKVKDPRLEGLKLDAYIGEDGVVVIHVETPNVPENRKGPKCRIYLNDSGDPLWDNPAFVPYDLLFTLDSEAGRLHRLTVKKAKKTKP